MLEAPAGGAVERGAYVLVDARTATDDSTSCWSAPAARWPCASTPPTLLAADGLPARVVSMPSWDLFEAQDDDYQDAVLPPEVPTLAVEAAAPASAGTAGPTTASASTASAPRPRATSRWQPRLHARERGRPGAPSSTISRRTTSDQAARPLPTSTARAPGSTTSGAGWITGGELAALGRARRAGHHVEPHDLPEGHRRLATTTTTSSATLVARRHLDRGRLLDAGRSPTSRTRLRILRPVHDESDGVDGFVSLEVAPDLAHDTAGTIGVGPRPARRASTSPTCS